MNKKIVVEGLPCAGKTSLAKSIVKECKSYSLVNEIAARLGNGEKFPGNARNILDAERINMWFIRKESERINEAKQLSSVTDVLIDRSFPSHLAYCYAYAIFNSLDIFDKTYEMYEAALKSELLELPDVFLYLRIDPSTMLKRLASRVYEDKRAILPDFWVNRSYLTHLNKAYDVFFDNIKKYVPTRVIDANQTHEAVYVEAKKALEGIQIGRRYINSDRLMICLREILQEDLKDIKWKTKI